MTLMLVGSSALVVAFAACGSGGSDLFGSTSTGSGGAGGHGGGVTTGPGTTASAGTGASSTASAGTGTGGMTTSTGGTTVASSSSGPPPCLNHCSVDQHSILDCHDNLVTACSPNQLCDVPTATCISGCVDAVVKKSSIGCEYYATNMDQFTPDVCFAAFVANTWSSAAHVQVQYNGATLNAAGFARIPSGAGPALTYAPYDPVVGIPPGEVAILFLAGSPTATPACPVPAAVPTGSMINGTTGIGHSFRITSDVPVVAYEINPYGGGSAATTGASLLLPTSAWDTGYLAVTAAPYDIKNPSMNVVASLDNTTVTMTPTSAVQGGGGLPPGLAGAPYVFVLNAGQQAQFSQQADLTGSVITSDKPIGFMAGQPCMRAPAGVAFCDHAEQMIPPVHALGNEYVGVPPRPRVPVDQGIWRVVGVVDGTFLSYSTSVVGAPNTLNLGQSVQFVTDQPFVVKSQGNDHPFMLFTYMSGSQWKPGLDGYGDADFVISVPPAQYLSDYVFFADPTYPETNLVLVREKAMNAFQPVTLDCLGTVGGWQPVGNYEWARVDLIRHDFQNVGGCSTGRHEIKSAGPFGLWVWGWGTPETTSFTSNVSYGYPGGMNVSQINTVTPQ
jgi:hypothetical protein